MHAAHFTDAMDNGIETVMLIMLSYRNSYAHTERFCSFWRRKKVLNIATLAFSHISQCYILDLCVCAHLCVYMSTSAPFFGTIMISHFSLGMETSNNVFFNDLRGIWKRSHYLWYIHTHFFFASGK